MAGGLSTTLATTTDRFCILVCLTCPVQNLPGIERQGSAASFGAGLSLSRLV